MPRSRGGRGRRSSSSSSAAPPDFDNLDVFDEAWLRRIRERFNARYIDLDNAWDRRRWHPDKLDSSSLPPKGLRWGPRVVVVPEGHRLARFQTYGGRYSLRAVERQWAVRQRRLGHRWDRLSPHEWPYGAVGGHRLRERGPGRRLGFHMPWQVIVCVRRQQRREVMHALNVAGRGGVGRGKRQYRGEWSNVRC